jgi:two-component system, response regulator, stage 0 sporulation protein F
MKKNILIVDDEAPIRKLFSRTIGTAEYSILTAASGVEALAQMREQRVDLVLLDLNMPKLDGADTLVQIRKLDEDVPVVIITSFKDAFVDKLRTLREAGIHFEVVNKPVEKTQLRTLVKKTLQGALKHNERGEVMKVIRLYTAGKNPAQMNAFYRLQKYLDSRSDVPLVFESIDVLEDPQAASREDIFVTPTIVRAFDPVARMVGDIQDSGLITRTLGLAKEPPEASPAQNV